MRNDTENRTTCNTNLIEDFSNAFGLAFAMFGTLFVVFSLIATYIATIFFGRSGAEYQLVFQLSLVPPAVFFCFAVGCLIVHKILDRKVRRTSTLTVLC